MDNVEELYNKKTDFEIEMEEYMVQIVSNIYMVSRWM